MKPKDVFGLVIRIFGVVGVLLGCFYWLSIIFYLMGVHPEGYTLYHYLAAGLMTMALGLYFLRGAPHIVRFAYPENEKKNGKGDDAA